MFNKNVFTQKDPIADLVKPMLEAQAKAKMEELKGNQKVLDKNKNNKLDSQDFKILRGEKKVNEEQVDESSPFDWKKPREPEVKGGAGVKKGRAYGGAAQKSKPEQETDDDKKMKKEEVEQIDELSKKKLASYVKSASDDRSWRSGSASAAAEQGKDKSSMIHHGKSLKRRAGIEKAVDRLSKEEVEQVDERTLTPGETSEKERIVKGMKKGMAGFKARYGERAKSVMYATATKAAKKD